MVSPDVVHHGIGHRGSFRQVRVLQPKPYPKTTVTTSHPQATPRPGTPSSRGGSIRHGNPPRSAYRIASNIRRIAHLRGRPTCEAAGRNRSIIAHSASFKALGKASPLRACCARVISVHMSASGLFAKPPESACESRVKRNKLISLTLISGQTLREFGLVWLLALTGRAEQSPTPKPSDKGGGPRDA